MSSNDAHVTRLTALAALGIALLYFISVPIGSLASLPASDASASDFAQFFAQHRAGLLVAVVLNGIAWCALLPVTFAGLRMLLGERGGIAATVALVCAGVEAALIGVALAFGAIAAVAFARSGLLSPSGIAQAAPPAFAIWMAWIGVVLLRRPIAIAVAAPAAA